MGLFDSSYERKYNSLMKQINNLNKQNVKGYNTFKEYVLADEIMISYFMELKELEKKFPRLHVDSFDTFKNNIYEQLKDVYIKRVNEIEKEKNIKEQYRKYLELRYDIKDSYDHCCNPELDILLDDINKKISLYNMDETSKKISKEKKLKYFDKEYNDYMKICKYNVKEGIDCFSNNVCIKCGCVFDKEIKSTKVCPECKTKNMVRTDMFSKEKLIISEDNLSEFEEYDNQIREILFFERIMKKKEYIYNDYMSDFYKYKEKGGSVRDILWQLANKVGTDLDNMGYKKFMNAIKKNKNERALENFDAIRCFELATLEYVTLYEIANYKNKKEIALELLTHIAYRDVQIVELDKEGDCFRSFKIDDYISNIHSGLIVEFLSKNKYKLEDFKQIFLNTRHPFILERLSNDETWNYIELAIKNQMN